MRRALACVATLLVFWPLAEAKKPQWAKPFLKMPVPEGDYIAHDDEWVSLHSEIFLSLGEEGHLIRTHRQVLAPLGDKPRRLSIALDYNEETQSLTDPRVWVPGVIGYREMKVRKSGTDYSSSGTGTVRSRRYLYVTSDEIRPEEKAVISWTVRNTAVFPGESIVWPFDRHPAAEWTVKVDPDRPGRWPPVFLSLPGGGEELAGGPDGGGLSYRQVPAYPSVYDDEDPWFADPLTALPAILVRSRAVPAGGESWSGLARIADGVMEDALQEDAGGWRDKARQVAGEGSSPLDVIARLADFAQSLKYRNIAWGEGAFIPESPSETLRTRSGDCKAKSLLLKAMLGEAGVRSRLVLCHLQERYSEVPTAPSLLAFNHVVVAIEWPGNVPPPPGTLLEGPGKGFVLFDPTDPMIPLGAPPAGLEGSQALWLDSGSGDLFTVRTRETGARRIRARLDVSIDSVEWASFRLEVEGRSPAVEPHVIYGTVSDGGGVRPGELRELLGSAVPGVEITKARLSPVGHVDARPARLEVEGRFSDPLLHVDGETHTLAAPTAMLGLVLGIPRVGYRHTMRVSIASRAEAPWFEPPEPCCQGMNIFVDGEIQVSLPDGFRLMAAPRMSPVDSAWLESSVEEGDPWRVQARILRGRFTRGSMKRRLAELDAVAGLFRKPFVVSAPEASSGRREPSPEAAPAALPARAD